MAKPIVGKRFETVIMDDIGEATVTRRQMRRMTKWWKKMKGITDPAADFHERNKVGNRLWAKFQKKILRQK